MMRYTWPLSFCVLTLSMVTNAQAQRRPNPLREIYPYQPIHLEDLIKRVERITENQVPLRNVYDITNRGLMSGSSNPIPWEGSFWPLIQGQIANIWQSKSMLKPLEYLSWKENLNDFRKRKRELLPQGLDMEEQKLAKLAPSEKYDLLLGDTNFDLTNRIWNFVETWGNQKMNGFLSKIDIPEGYRLPKANSRIALWEGICHGWALAAGGYPEPKQTVTITLPNGKRLPFYPTDIKALVSLAFANSLVQQETLIEGFRCNNKNPRQDEYGRFIDDLPSRDEIGVLPRCADVHPAVWHLAVVNLMGLQRRSLVVEIDANAKVNNHPLGAYQFSYFNPKSGRVGSLEKSMVDLADYRRDPYAGSRHADTRYVVGVEMRMLYVDWVSPDDAKAAASEGKFKKKDFLYDLELDAYGNVVGGQWRVNHIIEFVTDRGSDLTTNQPDFFWVLPKNYMRHFQGIQGLPEWRVDSSRPAPQEWKNAAFGAHSFMFQETAEFGFNSTCPVIRGKQVLRVPCEFKHPKPQPLLNVVNQLVELSR